MSKDVGGTPSLLQAQPVSFRETWRVIPLPRERSLVVSLLCHWASLTAHANLPSIDKLDPRALPVAWRNCLLLRCDEGDEWSLEYQGDGFVLPGFTASNAPEDPTDTTPPLELFQWIAIALQSASPVTVGGAMQDESGQQIRFRTLLLPFGNEAGTVTRLLAASTARDLLSLEPRHLPIEAYAYIDGFWIRQSSQQ